MGFYNLAYQFEGDPSQPFTDNLRWKSRRNLLNRRVTFNAFLLVADTGDRQDWYDTLLEYRAILKRNAALIANGTENGTIGEVIAGGSLSINGDVLEDPPSLAAYSGDLELSVSFYVDGVLHAVIDVYANEVPLRIPGGVRGRSFEMLISGNVPRIRRFEMASSMAELMVQEQQGE